MRRDFEIIQKGLVNLNEKIDKMISIVYETDLPDDDNENIINNLEEAQKELAFMWQNMLIMKSVIRKANLILIKRKIGGDK